MEVLKCFADELVHLLQSCFRPRASCTKERAKMWAALHQLRISPIYKALWSGFLKSLTCEADPIFYQYVGDQLFKILLKKQCVLHERETPHADVGLSYEEKNVIRYTAGYIPRALRKKIDRSSHPLKKELSLCLLDLTEECEVGDESCEWINAIDRGGLIHVSENMYWFTASMELEVKKHLSTSPSGNTSSNLKSTLQDAVGISDDVLFYWSMVSANWGEEESKALFAMIVELWITIRGFGFTSTWMERYKLCNKKSVQKSKGLRKTLIGKK